MPEQTHRELLPVIQSLWIGDSLSVMEQLCITSFLENGGYWVDMDVTCLTPFAPDVEHIFASERLKFSEDEVDESFDEEKTVKVASCVLKAPVGSEIMDYCFNEADKKDTGKLEWGDTGPNLITEAVKLFDMGSCVVSPNIFCPVNWWDAEILIRGTQN